MTPLDGHVSMTGIDRPGTGFPEAGSPAANGATGA